MFSVGIFVVHGFDPWQCGEILHIAPQKNFPCTCSERILETGHAHTHTHTHTHTHQPFSIRHTKPHSSSPNYVCLQHLIQ